MTTTKQQTEIIADPNLPTIKIIREFEAAPDKVFRAWTDPKLFVQWNGPCGMETRLDTWDARTGGSWRYAAVVDGNVVASFYGAFHEVRPSERLVQTFTWDGQPDGVALETMTFVDLGDGRTRVEALSVVDSMDVRDAMIASGMEVGVNDGFAKLDELLAR